MSSIIASFYQRNITHPQMSASKEYYQIKVTEMLLYLSAMTVENSWEIKPYYYKTQMEKIKAVHAQITGNIKERYTIEALSVMYEIPATTMKKCFKDVYGDSIDRLHRWERTKDGDIGHPLRDQRGMRTCAVLLHLPWRGSVSKVYGRGSHAGDRPLVSVCAFVL